MDALNIEGLSADELPELLQRIGQELTLRLHSEKSIRAHSIEPEPSVAESDTGNNQTYVTPSICGSYCDWCSRWCTRHRVSSH